MKLDETGAKRIEKYLPDVIKFITMREAVERGGGQGFITMKYQDNRMIHPEYNIKPQFKD